MPLKNVKMIGFADIFHFAEKEFGVHWNPANDLFFRTIFNYGSMSQIYTSDLACDISFFDDAKDISECKASLVPREEYDKMSQREKAKLIVMLFCEKNNIEDDFYVDCT